MSAGRSSLRTTSPNWSSCSRVKRDGSNRLFKRLFIGRSQVMHQLPLTAGKLQPSLLEINEIVEINETPQSTRPLHMNGPTRSFAPSAPFHYQCPNRCASGERLTGAPLKCKSRSL